MNQREELNHTPIAEYQLSGFPAMYGNCVYTLRVEEQTILNSFIKRESLGHRTKVF